MPESQAPTRLLSEDEVRSDAHGSAWSDPPPPDAERDPLLGTTLNQTYTLVRLLGTGGMGRVYEATHSRIKNKRYAIKVLHPELCFSSEVRLRFQREAEAAACVAHPNAVGIYDVALTPEGWPYLVCEFLEGKELAALLRTHGRLSPRQAIDITLQMCRVLSEAHKGGVVHRDLKPHNVFLVGDFDAGMPERLLVKVLDFGLSRFLEGGTELTKTGAILGTPAYMAPEQARGERADHRTDIYGAGAVLYACVTGRSPFRGDTPQAVLISVMSQEPPRPSTLNPFISAELELVIQRAMARDPNDRYPSMDAMLEALEALDAAPSPRHEARGPRRMASSAALVDEAPASARLDLLLMLVLAAAFTIVALVSSITGLAELWFGDWPLSPMETLLVTLVVVGTLLTPVILLLYRLRARVWSNTARVVELLLSVRRAVLTAVLTYGTLAILLLFWDHAGRRLFGERLPLGDATLSWAGLPVTLLGSASFMIAAELFHGKLTAQGGWVTKLGSTATERRRRWLAGPGLFGAGVLLATMTVVLALAGRSKALDGAAPALLAEEPVAAKPGPAKVSAPAKAATKPTSSPEPLPTPSAAAPEKQGGEKALASATELRTATSRGAEALLALSERFPEDPKVARALGVHYAASAATLQQSLETFSKLFELDPAAAADKDVRQLILQMSEISGPVQKRAFEVLAFEMGHEGTDQLYRMALTEPKRKDLALRHLKKAQERGTVSEALRIAMDLQYDSSCEHRVPLLPRAIEHGDERSVQVLAALSTARRACGRRKKELCKPTCPAQAEQFREAVESITKRLAEKPTRN